MKTYETKDAVIVSPPNVNAVVIWLHGLGADGHDFEPIVAKLTFAAKNNTRFIFPHAPHRPVTLNGGYVMRAWYDIVAISAEAPQDEAGIRASAQLVEHYIATQVQEGIQPQRIVIAGFSQGGAIALHTGLRYPQPLAGIMALSCYLPLSAQLATELHPANAQTSIFMAHGTYDDIVPIQLAEHSRQVMQQQGCHIDWHTYPMPHSVCPQEIDDISLWLNQVLR